MSLRYDRARRLLLDKGGWIEATTPGVYVLRILPDRRARVVLRLDESEFTALARDPGLAVRKGGGFQARRASGANRAGLSGDAPGRIDAIETRTLPDGATLPVRVNLGDSAIAWLARRKDAAGRPWLTPTEVAAGLRLTRDAELAMKGPSLTQRWDALPRSGAGTAARVEPGETALAAGRRVAAALAAAGPRLAPMLEAVCIRSSALQAAEGQLGLRRRQGKTVLKHALQALAEHYGTG
ncbi:DUF6456 domain-containing protein [Brevundimonas sp.]|uniref:DUF6456 domain-containing protein n=1 Tax=Brevundimonas sp. TaxID=1871086 RepID=UPI0035125483